MNSIAYEAEKTGKSYYALKIKSEHEQEVKQMNENIMTRAELKAERKKRGLSQHALAELIGVKDHVISNAEYGISKNAAKQLTEYYTNNPFAVEQTEVLKEEQITPHNPQSPLEEGGRGVNSELLILIPKPAKPLFREEYSCPLCRVPQSMLSNIRVNSNNKITIECAHCSFETTIDLVDSNFDSIPLDEFYIDLDSKIKSLTEIWGRNG